MKSPRDPKSKQPANPNEPIDVRHQIGVMRNSVVVPQPAGPNMPRVPMPERSSNLAALQGTKFQKG